MHRVQWLVQRWKLWIVIGSVKREEGKAWAWTDFVVIEKWRTDIGRHASVRHYLCTTKCVVDIRRFVMNYLRQNVSMLELRSSRLVDQITNHTSIAWTIDICRFVSFLRTRHNLSMLRLPFRWVNPITVLTSIAGPITDVCTPPNYGITYGCAEKVPRAVQHQQHGRHNRSQTGKRAGNETKQKQRQCIMAKNYNKAQGKNKKNKHEAKNKTNAEKKAHTHTKSKLWHKTQQNANEPQTKCKQNANKPQTNHKTKC